MSRRCCSYNFEHARRWLELGQRRGVPVIYASTSALYGRSRLCRVGDPVCERPLNPYGYSKLLLDRWVQRTLESLTSPVLGFRFFNVFGPGEDHKAHNASIPTRFFQFLRDQGHIDLFEDDIRRDYVHVRRRGARPCFAHGNPGSRQASTTSGAAWLISHREIAESVVSVAREADAARPRADPMRCRCRRALRARFQFYTRPTGVLPWVAELTAAPGRQDGRVLGQRAHAEADDGRGPAIPRRSLPVLIEP